MILVELPVPEQIDWYARRIIVASMQYYILNRPKLSDRDYDAMAKHLESLINQNDVKECQYADVLKDYTSATGFDLPDKVKQYISQKHYDYLLNIATHTTDFRSEADIKQNDKLTKKRKIK